MRISGWSSDVCSSDLQPLHRLLEPRAVDHPREIAEGGEYRGGHKDHPPGRVAAHCPPQERRPGGGMGDGAIHVVDGEEIGRASCRGRVCQDVSISLVAVVSKKKDKTIKEH